MDINAKLHDGNIDWLRSIKNILIEAIVILLLIFIIVSVLSIIEVDPIHIIGTLIIGIMIIITICIV